MKGKNVKVWFLENWGLIVTLILGVCFLILLNLNHACGYSQNEHTDEAIELTSLLSPTLTERLK